MRGGAPGEGRLRLRCSSGWCVLLLLSRLDLSRDLERPRLDPFPVGFAGAGEDGPFTLHWPPEMHSYSPFGSSFSQRGRRHLSCSLHLR